MAISTVYAQLAEIALTSSFPHHFHRGNEDTVIESHLDPRPERAIRQVLAFVRQTLLKEAKRPV